MNDEMKEPDEEKALSESDERKPDFKAEQFSDGASDTPSSEIPPSNEDDGTRKNEENDSLLTRENRSGTNGKKQPARLRRPASVAAKRKGSHSDTNRARGPKKSTT